MSNWVEVNDKLINLDTVFQIHTSEYWIYLYFNTVNSNDDYNYNALEFGTKEQAQAEYERIKKLLINKD